MGNQATIQEIVNLINKDLKLIYSDLQTLPYRPEVEKNIRISLHDILIIVLRMLEYINTLKIKPTKDKKVFQLYIKTDGKKYSLIQFKDIEDEDYCDKALKVLVDFYCQDLIKEIPSVKKTLIEVSYPVLRTLLPFPGFKKDAYYKAIMYIGCNSINKRNFNQIVNKAIKIMREEKVNEKKISSL